MQRPPIRDVISLAIVLVVITLVGFTVLRLGNEVDRNRALYDELHGQYELLYTEAVEAGATPEAPAPEDVPEAAAPDPVVPIDGLNGADGEDGEDGKPGRPGRDGKDGEPGKDGKPGVDGEDGADGGSGEPGAGGVNGADGEPGAPGRGIQSMQCATGGWIVTYTDSLTENSGPCRGPQGDTGPAGADGEDGVDGVDGKDGQFKEATFSCPPGEYIGSFTVTATGEWSVECRGLLG